LEPDLFESFNSFVYYTPSSGVITGIIVILILLICSALISASELAFFSLTTNDLNTLKRQDDKSARRIISLTERVEKLLATILITNNFINVGIIIISTYVTASLLVFYDNHVLVFIIQIVVISFLILLFGEIIPKLFAKQHAVKFASVMSFTIVVLEKIFSPISSILLRSTNFAKRKLKIRSENISMGELSDALDLTSGVVPEEKTILKSIVKFGNIEVVDIMKPRMDIVAVEKGKKFSEVVEFFNTSGYSRIPVYEETLDNISGILYVKDLLACIEKDDSFHWEEIVRPAYFIPESKKINVLLQEFREKKIHLAIVVDEYGGTEGIVTLEDVLEEIVGDITDESDEIETLFVKIDENNYVFDAKVLLNDFYKALSIDADIFEEVRGDADTLAGLILEVKGEIPIINEKLNIDKYTFTIVSSDKRRIKKVKVSIGNAG
jgi:putative hemolysin